MNLEIGSRLDPVGGTVHIAAALQKWRFPIGTLITSKTLELCRSEQDSRLRRPARLAPINAKAYRLSRAPGSARGHGPHLPVSRWLAVRNEREILRSALGGKERSAAPLRSSASPA